MREEWEDWEDWEDWPDWQDSTYKLFLPNEWMEWMMNVEWMNECWEFPRCTSANKYLGWSNPILLTPQQASLATTPSTKVDVKSLGSALNLLAFLAFLDIVLNIFIIYYYYIETPFIQLRMYAFARLIELYNRILFSSRLFWYSLPLWSRIIFVIYFDICLIHNWILFRNRLF